MNDANFLMMIYQINSEEIADLEVAFLTGFVLLIIGSIASAVIFVFSQHEQAWNNFKAKIIRRSVIVLLSIYIIGVAVTLSCVKVLITQVGFENWKIESQLKQMNRITELGLSFGHEHQIFRNINGVPWYFHHVAEAVFKEAYDKKVFHRNSLFLPAFWFVSSLLVGIIVGNKVWHSSRLNHHKKSKYFWTAFTVFFCTAVGYFMQFKTISIIFSV